MSPNKPDDAASPSNAAHKTNNSDKPKTCKRLRVDSPDDETKRKTAKLSNDAWTSKNNIYIMFEAIDSDSNDNRSFKRFIKTDAEEHTWENDVNYTLLHMAAHCSNHEKFQILLDHNYDINAKAKLDLTPLHIAAFMANHKIVKSLIERNVDVNCRSKDSKLTPLHLASTMPFLSKIYNSTEEFNLMNKLIGIVPLYDSNESRAIELLMESGADVNARDAYGNTPLHAAAFESDEKVIEVLLKFGAYVDVKNVDGDLPLHNVLKSFNVDGLTKLLEFGADINEVSEEFQGIREYESSQANAFCNSVLEHTNKLRAADLPVDEVYKSDFHKSFWLSHRAECTREVDRLKTYFLVDEVSLYDFLQMNVRRRRAYVKYVPFDLEMKFPKYYGIVYGSCRQAEVRRSLVELAKVVWERLTKIELPDLCLEFIFMLLDNSDLTFFVAGAEC